MGGGLLLVILNGSIDLRFDGNEISSHRSLLHRSSDADLVLLRGRGPVIGRLIINAVNWCLIIGRNVEIN
jgi:hypothetical protein